MVFLNNKTIGYRTMNREEFIEQIDKAQLSYNRPALANTGSNYISIMGFHFRVSDHTKPSWQSYSGIDCNSWDEVFNVLKEAGINLSDRSSDEELFKKVLINEVEVLENGEAKHPIWGHFNSTDSLLNSAWVTTLRNEYQENI